ncbi:hypothetical protein SEA_ACOLYTE_32 [Mycobacterium phage Acolyte]|nr:hypothetical protein SEA_ACOLYTE_32 [Mycobacterium phage Acolyte]
MAGILLGGTNIANLSLGTTPILRVSLGTDLIWPAFIPVPTQITTAGAYTYNIPSGCSFIDVILLSAGGGGMGMGFATAWGEGGYPGNWLAFTLRRGIDIPMGTLAITGTVGAGGAAGAGGLGGGPGGNGGNTTAVATGMTTRTAIGGLGGTARNLAFGGRAAGDQVWNNRTYTGGGLQAGPSGAGLPPGGGGAGATVSVIAGGAGAIGSAWFYAY